MPEAWWATVCASMSKVGQNNIHLDSVFWSSTPKFIQNFRLDGVYGRPILLPLLRILSRNDIKEKVISFIGTLCGAKSESLHVLTHLPLQETRKVKCLWVCLQTHISSPRIGLLSKSNGLTTRTMNFRAKICEFSNLDSLWQRYSLHVQEESQVFVMILARELNRAEAFFSRGPLISGRIFCALWHTEDAFVIALRCFLRSGLPGLNQPRLDGLDFCGSKNHLGNK